MAGLTDEGFETKRLVEIKAGIEEDTRSALGRGINLDARSVLGQLVGIISGALDLCWQGLEAVYNAFSPSTATGLSLDRVVSLTGLTRLPQLKGTLTAWVYGDESTVVEAGFVASVEGTPASRFISLEDQTITAAESEVQTVTFSPGSPSSGNWRLTFDGQETANLAYNIDAATLQTALEALSNIAPGDVVVTGTVNTGFVITFGGTKADLQQESMTVTLNTLSSAQTVTVTETTRGGFGVAIAFQCEDFGPIAATAYSLTVIETPVSGVDSVLNYEDAVQGRNVETDAELRLRRAANVQRRGTATINGIRSALLNDVAGVTVALVVENATSSVDSDGRPPKSIEAIVEGGDDQEIADMLFATKPAGIETFGNVSKTVVASDGVSHTVKFSRPTLVPIFIIVNVTKNTNPDEGQVYPTDGDDQVIAALVEYGQNYTRGEDVVTSRLFTPINTVPGVVGIEVLIGLTDPPTLSANIPIAFNEVAEFLEANIEVNS